MSLSRKIGIVVVVGVLVNSILSLTIYYHHLKQTLLASELAKLPEETFTRLSNYENLISLATHNLETLAQLLTQDVMQRSEWQQPEVFATKIKQFADGSWGYLEENRANQQQARLLLGTNNELTVASKQFYLAALAAVDNMGSLAIANPIVENILLLDRDNNAVIFARDLADLDATVAHSDHPWIHLVSPANNPERKLIWIQLHDPLLNRSVVSALIPVDINGEWLATLRIDLDWQEVLALLQPPGMGYSGEQHLFIDQKGKLMLAEDGQQASADNSDSLPFTEAEVHLAARLIGDSENDTPLLAPITLKNNEYQVVKVTSAQNGWKYFRLVPTAAMIKPLTSDLANIAALLLLALFLLIILVNIAAAKLVVKPILAIFQRSGNDPAASDLSTVSFTGTKELKQLDNALAAMHDKFIKDRARLLASEERYRQFVTNINEVIIQIDHNEKWQFLSPVWEKLSGFSVAESSGQSIYDYLLHSDGERISHIVQTLLLGQRDSWEGDVRLKCSDNHYIWVDFSLRADRSQQEKITINGTIEDINKTRIALDIDKLIRETEQSALVSNATLNVLLITITEQLLYILNVAAVWVKVCIDNRSQILTAAGEAIGFIYDNNVTWSGLHSEDGPVMEAIKKHTAVRVTKADDLPPQWQQRLQFDEIEDSVFLPFYIGGDTQAVIGLHALQPNVFTKEIQILLLRFAEGLRFICKMVEDRYLMMLHQTAVEKATNAIAILDDKGVIEWVNSAFIKQTLYQAEDVLGKKTTIYETALPEAEQRDELWQQVQSGTGTVWNGEVVQTQKDGTKITVSQTVIPVIDELDEITHYIMMSEDITERKANQQRIAFMATHDELTKLPNKNLLNDRLQQTIEHAKRHELRMVVMFIDIDHFKYINDSLGHQIGDDLLQILAVRLQSVLRKEDTVARFGGDEFVVVLSDVTELNYVKSIATNLLDQIKKPYHIMEHELIITGSVGISIYPDDALNADDLVQQADSAMYLAKEQGRNNSQFFTNAINEKITRRLTLEKALRKAVEQQEFVLLYQPKHNLMTNRITGIEALIRWQHPELGLVSPKEFVPLAEETGIIIELGRWVMESACKQMQQWEKRFPELVNMSINVSARQFWQEGFVTDVEKILSQSGVSRHKIEFELTETVVFDEVDTAIATMSALKGIGITLSIDDFGTGYSSLSYLQKFPVDIIKIDSTFVDEMHNSDNDYAVVRSILALANNFKLKVVAEGIETEQQQHILTSLGCHYGQGYYCCMPLVASNFELYLAKQGETQYKLWED